MDRLGVIKKSPFEIQDWVDFDGQLLDNGRRGPKLLLLLDERGSRPSTVFTRPFQACRPTYYAKPVQPLGNGSNRVVPRQNLISVTDLTPHLPSLLGSNQPETHCHPSSPLL